MEQKDFYQMLGVEPDADPKQIKNTYRELAFKYHPDRNEGSPAAVDKMKAINEAYAVLSDPQKRREYDMMRQKFGSYAYNQFRQTHSEQDIFSGSDINRIFEEMTRAFGLRGFDEIFKEFYGPGYRTFEFKRPGFTAKGFVFTGHFGKAGVNKMKIPMWEHMGKFPRYMLKKLTGIEIPEDGADIHDVIHLTLPEAQHGGPYPYFLRKKDKKLVVKIPSGVRDGQKIRLVGMGEEGIGGGKPGDLYLKIYIKAPLIQKIKGFISGLRK